MKLKITVHGVAYDVDVEVLDAGEGFPASPLPRTANNGQTGPAPVAAPSSKPLSTTPEDCVTSPIAGTVMEVKCKAGDTVGKGQELIMVEAMKMEASIAAPAAGTVRSVEVAAGDAIREGQVVVLFD